MTVAVPNTNISNTFDYMRRRVNHLANAMSFNAVTVNSNAAVGNAEIIGLLRANTVYVDVIRGGNTAVAATLNIASNTAVSGTLLVSNNTTITQNLYANAVLSNTVITSLINVGNAILTSTTMTVNAYVGNWTGTTIPINRGGTGSTLVPANGNILIGNTTGYQVGAISGEQFLSVTNGPGAIGLKNLGVTSFGSNTTNVRSGNVVLGSADVIQALGYVPGSANSQTWIQVGNDLEFYGGNVAIGQFLDGTQASNAALAVRSVNASKPVLFADNANTSSNTQHAMINLGVANTGARMGLGFIRGANSANVVGAITYTSADTLSFRTAGVENVFIDVSGNLGIGTGTPTPNKGGNGLHIFGANPGQTFQSPSQQWQMGLNVNSNAYFNGVRNTDTFAIYNDSSSTGLFFRPANTTSSFCSSIVMNNVERMRISNDGSTYFIGPLRSDSDVFASGYQTVSDYREKHDITDLDLNMALSRVQGMRPVAFKYNNQTRPHEGFIAHELQEVIPTAVTGVKDGVVRQTVDKTEVIPTLVKAMQALINRVETLETELEELKNA